MQTVQTLQERLDEITGEMQRIADGTLDERSRVRFDVLEAEAKKLNADINRLSTLANIKYESRAPVGPPVRPTLVRGDVDAPIWRPTTRTGNPAAGEYRRMFRGVGIDHDDTGGFRSLGEFLSVVSGGRADPRLNTRAMSGSVATDGGFAMPAAYQAMLADEIFGQSVVLGMGVRTWPMTTREALCPAWDTTTMATGGPGGITAAWTAENSSAVESTPDLRQITLHARRLSAFVGVSRELIEDAAGFDQELIAAMGQTIAHELDSALVNGDGSGKPKGILQSGSLISVAADDAQEANSVSITNLSSAYARLYPAAQRRAVWLASPTVVPTLYALSVTMGTAGAWVQPMREDSGRFYVFGLPVHFSDWCPTVGNVGDINLVDPLSYVYGLLGDSIRIDVSQHFRFDKYQNVYLASVRCDGMCTHKSTVTASDGSNSYGAVVNIAARLT